MGVKNLNGPRMLKKRKRAENAQGKEMGQGCPKVEMGQGSLKAMEWAKEAQK